MARKIDPCGVHRLFVQWGSDDGTHTLLHRIVDCHTQRVHGRTAGSSVNAS
jgi:hypothetical protein